MIKVSFNGVEQSFSSFDDFAVALDRFDREPQFELWISIQDGSSIAMLRNGGHAWLMYLRFNGDKGLVSRGDPTRGGQWPYTLANGQVDEYPLAWCVDLEQCYRAMAYFYVNGGARYEFIHWQET